MDNKFDQPSPEERAFLQGINFCNQVIKESGMQLPSYEKYIMALKTIAIMDKPVYGEWARKLLIDNSEEIPEI